MYEYERRYLLRRCDRAKLAEHPSVRMSQGYLETYRGERPEGTAWVRIASDRTAFLVVVDGASVLRAFQLQDLALPFAQALLELCPVRVDKTRYAIDDRDGYLPFTVDVYTEPFGHIVIAETRPATSNQTPSLPSWCGPLLEVTDRICTYDIALTSSIETERIERVSMTREQVMRFTDVSKFLHAPAY